MATVVAIAISAPLHISLGLFTRPCCTRRSWERQRWRRFLGAADAASSVLYDNRRCSTILRIARNSHQIHRRSDCNVRTAATDRHERVLRDRFSQDGCGWRSPCCRRPRSCCPRPPRRCCPRAVGPWRGGPSSRHLGWEAVEGLWRHGWISLGEYMVLTLIQSGHEDLLLSSLLLASPAPVLLLLLYTSRNSQACLA